ncbi:MAG TPA: caspase family protein [Rectinemataceae bacterium]
MGRFFTKASLCFRCCAAILIIAVFPAALGSQVQPKDLGGQPAEGRVALVIGNSAYRSSPLANPSNDAVDMARALADAGFRVFLRRDLDLFDFESSLDEFARALKPGGTAVFYYAGHAVQVDGENYLIPVGEDIQNTRQVKSRGISLDDVLERIRASGSATALIFLDACRDNPFQGSSRSGLRGLALVSAPMDLETCIGYATQPGRTADDGSGRNGVFTAALLKNIGKPGLSLSDMMTNVIAEVKATTGGRQQPRFDNGLSAPFFFMDTASALARYAQELSLLDSQIQELQKKIDSSSNSAERYAMEAEQRKQEALRTAKKLEAENLARSSALQARIEAAAREESEGKTKAELDARARQEELSRLVASKRAELDKLAKDTASEDPDILLGAADKLASAMEAIRGEYAAALAKAEAATNAVWDKKAQRLAEEKPHITETDKEFEERIRLERQRVEAGREADLSFLRRNSAEQEEAQVANIRFQHEETLKSIASRTWTLRGKSVELEVGEFDRNRRIWPMTVKSVDKTLPADPLRFELDLGSKPDPKKAIVDMDELVQSKALAGEIDWGIRFDEAKRRYRVDLLAYRIRDLRTNGIVAEKRLSEPVAFFQPGSRKKPIPAKGRLLVRSALGASGDVYLEGNYLGRTPLDMHMFETEGRLEVRWNDWKYDDHVEHVTVKAGEKTEVFPSRNDSASYSAEKAKKAGDFFKLIGQILLIILILPFAILGGI